MKRYFQDKQKPPHATYAALDAALAVGFAGTQAHVHVESSALKFSGRKTSNWKNSGWEGEVSYGGEGIDYAVYEQQRGGEHDFMYPMLGAYAQMDEIIRRMK